MSTQSSSVTNAPLRAYRGCHVLAAVGFLLGVLLASPSSTFAVEPPAEHSELSGSEILAGVLGVAGYIVIPDIRYEMGDSQAWQLAWPIAPAFYATDRWEFAAGIEPQWRFTGPTNSHALRMATYGQVGYFFTNGRDSAPGLSTQAGYLALGPDRGPFAGLGVGLGGDGSIFGILARYGQYGTEQRFEVGLSWQLGRVLFDLFDR